MPHSAGGGSHGGGFHSSSSRGSSRSHISRRYFHGAKRFRRHYLDGREDDYVFARSIPAKTNISSIILVAIIGGFFIFAATFGIINTQPEKLKTKYMDAPAIHDDINVIDDVEEAELQKTIDDYCELTGICPVIYTVYSEDWKDTMDLESYTFNKYVDNFKDEQHLVIVYSVPEKQVESPVKIPDFEWHIVQGDETDYLLSKTVTTRFGNIVQNNFELGRGVGESLNIGFKRLYKDADSVVNPGSVKFYFVRIIKFIPLLVVLAIFVPMLILEIVQYRRDKNTVYEEVPLDYEVTAGSTFGIPVVQTEKKESASEGKTITPQNNYPDNSAGAFSGSSRKSSDGSYHASFKYDINKGGTILTAVIYGVVLFPFIIAGISMVIGGIVAIINGDGNEFGYFFLGFGIVWLLIVLLIACAFVRKILQLRKREKEPVKVSYPADEYPQTVYTDSQNIEDGSRTET